MNRDQAERWVVISALVVAGVYAYRRLTETPADTTSLKSVLGIGAPPKAGAFVTAWGFTFLGVSVLATASPPLGGAFAILIMAASFLTNGPAILGDVQKQQTTGLSAAAAAAQQSGATSIISKVPGVALPFTDPSSPLGAPIQGSLSNQGLGTPAAGVR